MTQKMIEELEKFFEDEGNSPEVINHEIKRASLLIATSCAHPNGLTTEDLEKIAIPLETLSGIMDIVDGYGNE